MLLAAGLLTTACSTYETDDPLTVTERSDMATLRINVYTPGEMSTRAEGQENATAAERQIHSIRVYAYLNESECNPQLINDNQLTISVDQLKQRCVGYAILDETTGLTVNDNLEYTWAEMGLPRYTINKKLDFYAMANMEGEGFYEVKALGFYPTRNAVETCKFTSFGTAKPVSKEVPKAGLPASRILKGLTPVTSLEGENRLSITLLRAVGKVRFFFAKPQGLTGAQVTGIKLNTGAPELTLPASALVMPTTNEETDGFKVALHNTSVTLPEGFTREATQISYTDFTNLNKDDATGMKEVEDPEVFVKGGKADDPISENFSQYISRLETYTTEYADGLTYIRESDGKIYGTVSYKLSAADDEKTANFELYTADNETHAQPCFPRNHYSVVYAYFKGGKLEVKPLLQPWEWEEDHQVEMESKGEILISILGDKGKQSYKVFDPTPNDGVFPSNINWNNAYVGVYYGEETDEEDPLFGQPLYSPLLHLKTKFSQPLTLHNTNPGFEFVKVTIGEHGARSFEHMDEITIPAWTEGTEEEPNPAIDTYFFVVPKTELPDAAIDVNNLPAERINKLYLLDENGYKLPVNPSFMPGPNNNEIWFFYMNSLDAYHNLNDYQ